MSLPPVRVRHPHVENRPDVLSGSPTVAGTKVPVRRLWEWHRKGETVETLVKRYPMLGPARVMSALAFAYDHQDIMEADLTRERCVLATETEAGLEAGRQQRLLFEETETEAGLEAGRQQRLLFEEKKGG